MFYTVLSYLILHSILLAPCELSPQITLKMKNLNLWEAIKDLHQMI